MLTQITLEKLFGTFDYRIDLKPDGLTVLIGPNGYGKTTILRIIDAIAQKNPLFFLGLNFEKITLIFDDKLPLSIEKKCNTINFVISGKDHFFEVDDFVENILKELPFTRRSSGEWLDRRTNRTVDVGKIFGDSSLYRYISRMETDVMESFFSFQFFDVYLIREQRLLSRIEDENELDERLYTRISPRFQFKPVYEESIEKYATSLIEIMDRADSKYAEKSRELDSSYPKRLFDSDGDINEDEFKKRFDQIRKTQRSLSAYGLSVTQDENPPAFDSRNAKALSVYLGDVEEKLKVFDELLKTLDLFTEILNSRCFVNKRISISKEYGLKFVTAKGTPLELKDLSSGEQHEVVLLFGLLFQAKPNTLVLIDEPEISLHIAWQMPFLADMLKIIELRKISIIVATHSPQIVNDRWDNVVDLGGTTDEQ